MNQLYVLVIAGLLTLPGCIQKNYYDANPNNNGNNYHSNDSTTTTYIFDDEFNGTDRYGWSFTDAADSTYASISGGTYQFVDYSKTNYPNSVVMTNASTSGTLTIQTRIQSNNMMGLVFGTSSSDNGYAFYVDSNGYYSLYKEGFGSVASTTIIPSTQDTMYATKKGWNTLEVDQANGTWTGYINGTQVFSMAARTLGGSGFGFKVAPATVGYADYLYVKSY